MNSSLMIDADLLGLWDSEDSPIPLEGVQVETELALPMAITRHTQSYRNTMTTPIEARYVFPVPLDAVILELEIRIADRVLQGVVKPKAEAERDYETAIVKGDSAFLLTKLDDGLYQISLGNILSGEQVELSVTWGETLRWNGQDIRYRLPNLVGDHYGNPQQAGIAPDNAPTHSGAVAYDFNVRVLLRGNLAQASVSSPNHRIRTIAAAEGQLVLSEGSDWLDRSFKLVMHAATPPGLVAWSAPDGDNLAVMASCYPPVPTGTDQPRHVTLLIDGSGSMKGTSIDQAKAAALEIIRALRDQDTCSLAAFGSETQLLTNKPLQVGEHRQGLLALCQRLNANLGGTEMLGALERVMTITPQGGDILMVTDGQVYSSDSDIRKFVRHQRRLFTIGVGHSTSEKILRQLSEASGGFCELVSPNEDMASHIVSHFRRLRAPRLQPTYIWPGQVVRQDTPNAVFAGDTAILCARLQDIGSQQLRVNMAHADLKADIEPAQGKLASLLPRLVASRLLATDNIKQAREEAVHYQLVTEHTSMIAVMERDQTSDSVVLPTIIDVPQMDPYESLGECRSIQNYSTVIRSNGDTSGSVSSMSFNRPMASYVDASMLSPESCTNSGPLTDTDWLLDLNIRIENGEALSDLLVMAILPLVWQKTLPSLSEHWPEEMKVLAVIVQCLETMPASQLRQCRELRKAVIATRSNMPSTDLLLQEMTALQ